MTYTPRALLILAGCLRMARLRAKADVERPHPGHLRAELSAAILRAEKRASLPGRMGAAGRQDAELARQILATLPPHQLALFAA